MRNDKKSWDWRQNRESWQVCKHDKPILDINAVRANRDHFRHWEIRLHDYCLLEGYRNPAKDRLTQTADHYIEAKRPFELAVLRGAIPSSEWNTLVDIITSKIPPDDADKPWIWLQKIKDHYVGASTLMQDRYHFWVQMAQADQTSISAWETAVRTAAGRCSFRLNADEFMRDKFLFGLNESFSRFREHIFYRDGQRKPEDPPFTLAFKPCLLKRPNRRTGPLCHIHNISQKFWTAPQQTNQQILLLLPYMSNTLDLSRVVFTPGRIESDRDRKRKWVYGGWSAAAEVTVNRSERGWKSRQTYSIGSDGDRSSWQKSIGLSEVS